MRLRRRNSSLSIALFALIATPLAAQIGSTVPNWTVPPYSRLSVSGGLTPMADISDGTVFVAVTPCRVVDTRNAAGPYGGPALATNVARPFDVNNGPCSGIPTIPAAYSLSIGAILPPADGFLSAWPTGSSQPLISQLNFLAGEVVANAAIVPAGDNGAINVLVNIGPTNVYIDINGYFMDSTGDMNANVNVEWHGSTTNSFMFVQNSNTSTSGTNTAAIRGLMMTTQSGPSAVVGEMTGATGAHFGVKGKIASLTEKAAGVLGETTSASSSNFGVWGRSLGTSTGSAGVIGIGGGGGTNFFDQDAGTRAGVRGEDQSSIGVYGLTEYNLGIGGVVGQLIDFDGTVVVSGRLGSQFGGVAYGVFSAGPSGSSGMKSFVDPHPYDPDLVIRYVSLEGPESGTYFRGKGRFLNGLATIEVPADFQMVTDRENLSIQVTPIGGMATVGVRSISLERIVVEGSRDFEFFYTVNGVRRTHKDVKPVGHGREFVPETPDARIPGYLTAEQKRLLVANGTYREDGSVNMETARRLGWDKVWERRSRPAPQDLE